MQKIILNKPTEDNAAAVVTIGNFDGMHLGHQELFKKSSEIAHKNNYRVIVITFEPLPLEYFCDQLQKSRQPRLSLLRDKINVLQNLGYIDEVLILHFNSSIANLTPQEFIVKILKNKLNVKHAVIGYDFKFGKNGTGNADDLTEYGIIVHEINPYLKNELLISSSIIRELATHNKLAKIKSYLGRNLQYTSRVIYGNQLGRKYNVPTINLSLGKNIPALHGIYIARVHIDGASYNAVVSIGKNPTTNKHDRYNLEAHLLGINLDLYGKIATVEILKFMREEAKFIDLGTLFKQIHIDVANAWQYFETEIIN